MPKHSSLNNALLTLTIGLASGIALSQEPEADTPAEPDNEFRLFEDVAEPESETSRSASRRDTPDSSERGSGNNDPMFTLVGTTRIGSKRSVMLEHKSGNRVTVPIVDEQNSQIPGYINHRVVGFRNGEVNVRLPSDEPCIEDTSKGVSCSGASNIAQLSLASRSPVAPGRPLNAAAQNGNPAASPPGAARAQENEVSAPAGNPFEQIRQARAAALNGDAPAQRFTPRRIAPEDVPEGMRVVSTPFGDRLVEANN